MPGWKAGSNAVKPNSSECRIYFRHIERNDSCQRYPARKGFLALRECISSALHLGRLCLAGCLDRIVDLQKNILPEISFSLPPDVLSCNDTLSAKPPAVPRLGLFCCFYSFHFHLFTNVSGALLDLRASYGCVGSCKLSAHEVYLSKTDTHKASKAS